VPSRTRFALTNMMTDLDALTQHAGYLSLVPGHRNHAAGPRTHTTPSRPAVRWVVATAVRWVISSCRCARAVFDHYQVSHAQSEMSRLRSWQQAKSSCTSLFASGFSTSSVSAMLMASRITSDHMPPESVLPIGTICGARLSIR